MADAEPISAHVWLQEWIKGRGPKDRHAIVDRYNWGQGFDLLLWVLRQPDTDLATVKHMFWHAEASYFLQFPDRAAAGGDRNFDFLVELIERWNTGQYRSHGIAFAIPNPNQLRIYKEAATKHAAQGLPWKLDVEAMASSEAGARIDHTTYKLPRDVEYIIENQGSEIDEADIPRP
jgi:hypothetical protein